jgi:3-oxoacyl-[acyl-carrier protein] reductase
MRRLLGKKILITGGGRGLGRAIALACAAEGASVALSYAASAAGARATVREIEQLGSTALALHADLTERDQIAALASQALAQLGRIDVLINNAGEFSAAPLLKTDPATWDRLLAVNLTAPFLLSQALAPAMLAAGGVMLNLASGGGQHPRPGYDPSPAYAASKAGLIMLSKKLALELAPSIRVNCLAPGVIDSKPTPLSAEVRERFVALTPLRQVGTPAHVAAAAVFLASDESSFITGQVLNVDGGILI